MRIEVGSAVDFLSNILRTRELSEVQLEKFRVALTDLLLDHYEHHWFPEKPHKGSGYRCIRINHKMDPILARAATKIGLTENTLFALFPAEFTMWVDPDEVCYRIGEEGSIGVLFEQTSPASSTSSTPTPIDNSPTFEQPESHLSQSSLEFFQKCKQQFRSCMPEADHNAMNLEYLSSFVAS